jgi:hypothetical protein
MQCTLIAVFGMVMLSVAIAAPADTDFTGTWKMDMARSESAHQAVPIGAVTVVIKQTPAELTVETRRAESGATAASGETLTYKLDGSENKITGNADVPVKTKARWDGANLVTETVRTVQGASVTVTHVFSLDATRQELTIGKTLTIQHGYQSSRANNRGTGKDVFTRVAVESGR